MKREGESQRERGGGDKNKKKRGMEKATRVLKTNKTDECSQTKGID